MELSDRLHCLLLVHLEQEGAAGRGGTLGGAKQLLEFLGPEVFVEMCYPIRPSCMNVKTVYNDALQELDALIGHCGNDLNVEELV